MRQSVWGGEKETCSVVAAESCLLMMSDDLSVCLCPVSVCVVWLLPFDFRLLLFLFSWPWTAVAAAAEVVVNHFSKHTHTHTRIKWCRPDCQSECDQECTFVFAGADVCAPKGHTNTVRKRLLETETDIIRQCSTDSEQTVSELTRH